MNEDVLDNSEFPQQETTAVNSNKPSAEKILEGHCRLMTAIYPDKSPQDRLISMLRRVYLRGKDNQLEFENFSPDFQTQEIKNALNKFAERRNKK
jgi:hypothetical protein